jgi:multidrug efflux pump subunit AcrB
VREAGAHRIDVIERVKARLAELDSALPPGVEIVPTSPATRGGRPAR